MDICCDKLKCTYNETGCSDCKLGQMINKLEEYERIELIPKQILEIKKELKYIKNKFYMPNSCQNCKFRDYETCTLTKGYAEPSHAYKVRMNDCPFILTENEVVKYV